MANQSLLSGVLSCENDATHEILVFLHKTEALLVDDGHFCSAADITPAE